MQWAYLEDFLSPILLFQRSWRAKDMSALAPVQRRNSGLILDLCRAWHVFTVSWWMALIPVTLVFLYSWSLLHGVGGWERGPVFVTGANSCFKLLGCPCARVTRLLLFCHRLSHPPQIESSRNIIIAQRWPWSCWPGVWKLGWKEGFDKFLSSWVT